MLGWPLDIAREERGEPAGDVCAENDPAIIGILSAEREGARVRCEHRETETPGRDPLPHRCEADGNPAADHLLDERAGEIALGRKPWEQHEADALALEEGQESGKMIPLRVSEDERLECPIPEGPHRAQPPDHRGIRPAIDEDVRTPGAQKNRVALADIEQVEAGGLERALRKQNLTADSCGQQQQDGKSAWVHLARRAQRRAGAAGTTAPR